MQISKLVAALNKYNTEVQVLGNVVTESDIEVSTKISEIIVMDPGDEVHLVLEFISETEDSFLVGDLVHELEKLNGNAKVCLRFGDGDLVSEVKRIVKGDEGELHLQCATINETLETLCEQTGLEVEDLIDEEDLEFDDDDEESYGVVTSNIFERLPFTRAHRAMKKRREYLEMHAEIEYDDNGKMHVVG